LQVLVEGIKLSRRLGATRAFAPYCGGEAAPGAQIKSDAEIAEAIRGNAQTLYHPVGTCKMGNDPLAVVDARLRVRGTEGLRVVDASVMPTIPPANTNLTCIMIGERAADWMRGEA
jgi:choline dehydrogenase